MEGGGVVYYDYGMICAMDPEFLFIHNQTKPEGLKTKLVFSRGVIAISHEKSYITSSSCTIIMQVSLHDLHFTWPAWEAIGIGI